MPAKKTTKKQLSPTCPKCGRPADYEVKRDESRPAETSGAFRHEFAMIHREDVGADTILVYAAGVSDTTKRRVRKQLGANCDFAEP